MMKLQQHNTVIIAEVGDITKQAVEGIVNAANSQLAGGGGVDGTIHNQGGPLIMRELDVIRRERGGCPTGEAVITTGGQLKARYVIHTVGPIYSGRDDDAELLAACYHSSLKLAQAYNLKSLAFPSISTGTYRYPIEQAAPIAIDTVLTSLSDYDFTEIRFVLFSRRDYEIYKTILTQERAGLIVIQPD